MQSISLIRPHARETKHWWITARFYIFYNSLNKVLKTNWVYKVFFLIFRSTLKYRCRIKKAWRERKKALNIQFSIFSTINKLNIWWFYLPHGISYISKKNASSCYASLSLKTYRTHIYMYKVRRNFIMYGIMWATIPYINTRMKMSFLIITFFFNIS